MDINNLPIVNHINKHITDKIWNSYEENSNYKVKPRLLHNKPYVGRYAATDLRGFTLPDASTPWLLYEMGSLSPGYFKIFMGEEEWYKLSDEMMETYNRVRLISQNRLLSTYNTYIGRIHTGNLILAIDISVASKISKNLADLTVEFYRNNWQDDNSYFNYTLKVSSRVYTTEQDLGDHKNALIDNHNSATASTYVNGLYYMNVEYSSYTPTVSQLKVGDILDGYSDTMYQAAPNYHIFVPLKGLLTFKSDINKKQKYILFNDKTRLNMLVLREQMLFLTAIKKSTNYKVGFYIPVDHESGLTQLVQGVFAINVDYIQNILDREREEYDFTDTNFAISTMGTRDIYQFDYNYSRFISKNLVVDANIMTSTHSGLAMFNAAELEKSTYNRLLNERSDLFNARLHRGYTAFNKLFSYDGLHSLLTSKNRAGGSFIYPFDKYLNKKTGNYESGKSLGFSDGHNNGEPWRLDNDASYGKQQSIFYPMDNEYQSVTTVHSKKVEDLEKVINPQIGFDIFLAGDDKQYRKAVEGVDYLYATNDFKLKINGNHSNMIAASYLGQYEPYSWSDWIVPDNTFYYHNGTGQGRVIKIHSDELALSGYVKRTLLVYAGPKLLIPELDYTVEYRDHNNVPNCLEVLHFKTTEIDIGYNQRIWLVWVGPTVHVDEPLPMQTEFGFSKDAYIFINNKININDGRYGIWTYDLENRNKRKTSTMNVINSGIIFTDTAALRNEKIYRFIEHLEQEDIGIFNASAVAWAFIELPQVLPDYLLKAYAETRDECRSRVSLAENALSEIYSEPVVDLDKQIMKGKYKYRSLLMSVLLTDIKHDLLHIGLPYSLKESVDIAETRYKEFINMDYVAMDPKYDTYAEFYPHPNKDKIELTTYEYNFISMINKHYFNNRIRLNSGISIRT